jgi:hypothetical protein
MIAISTDFKKYGSWGAKELPLRIHSEYNIGISSSINWNLFMIALRGKGAKVWTLPHY